MLFWEAELVLWNGEEVFQTKIAYSGKILKETETFTLYSVERVKCSRLNTMQCQDAPLQGFVDLCQ